MEISLLSMGRVTLDDLILLEAVANTPSPKSGQAVLMWIQGHYPGMIDGRGETSYRKELSGPVVGAMGEIDYGDLNLTLAPGDAFLLYTDGVTEAMDEKRELYSDEHLLAEAARLGKGEVDEVIEGIMESVAAHVRGAPQSDDIAILMVRYRGPVTEGQSQQERNV